MVNVYAESTANDEQQQQQDEEKQQDKVIDAGVIVRPQRKVVAGSTANYTYFHLDQTRSMKMFVSYLMSKIKSILCSVYRLLQYRGCRT